MALPNSISELTNGAYDELEYNQNNEIQGNFVIVAKRLLRKCNINIDNENNIYDLSMEQAVMEFQKQINIPQTGILNNRTWNKLVEVAEQRSDTIEDVTNDLNDITEEEDDYKPSPHFESFFDERNLKTHRKNNKDIKIVFGNSNISKTIKNVFMRSVSVEVDTSGNPISEVYEFIAQDIIETDEFRDRNKYLYPESIIDMDVKYSYDRVLNNSNNNTSNGGSTGNGGIYVNDVY